MRQRIVPKRFKGCIAYNNVEIKKRIKMLNVEYDHEKYHDVMI